jgi:ribonucleoside-diphosphate reductase beta chain
MQSASNGTAREGFASLRDGGLRFTSLPMRLFQKGNRLFWNPGDIDFSRDADDWSAMTFAEREGATILASSFIAGEESVTQDIQPFMRAMATEGRLEDEMYLTQFAFEEAKHIEAFRRWLDAVGETHDLHERVDDNPGYRQIFYDVLPEALNRLEHDASPAAQVRAAVVYNQVVEGVLAMTGYHVWARAIESRSILPAMQEAIALIARDERRHMAWGTYTCRRHIAADASNWDVVQTTLDELIPPSMTIIEHNFASFTERGIEFPFGITQDELMSFAMDHFSRRLEVIEAAKERSVAEVEGGRIEEDLEAELEEESMSPAKA